ncbi:hypothetical protein GGI42DRAFT_278679 [Trichoderma sp. SZMC 28013]
MHTLGVIRKVEQGIKDGHYLAERFVYILLITEQTGLTAKTHLPKLDNSRGITGCRSCKHMAEEQHDVCLDDYRRRDLYGYHGSAWTENREICIPVNDAACFVKDASSLSLNTCGPLLQHQHTRGILLCYQGSNPNQLPNETCSTGNEPSSSIYTFSSGRAGEKEMAIYYQALYSQQQTRLA